MSCKACQRINIKDLFRQAFRTPAYITLHSSYDLLELAAGNGCTTCQILRRRFNEDHGDLEKRVLQLKEARGAAPPIVVFLQMAYGENGTRTINKFHVQISDGPERPGIDQLKISFRVSEHWGTKQKEEQTPFTFQYTELDHDLGSDQNFHIANSWIRECCTSHDPAICPALDNVDLPTRLIDVGNSPDDKILRLKETAHCEKGRYLALSHCWGPPGTKKLLTTINTLMSRLESIDQNEMPVNFSDAVIITRRLGYRFLWIDSLCIIQDSKSDWEKESQNMGRIYTNAALTLAAASATSSEGGMLIKSYQSLPTATLAPKNWFLEDSIGRSNIALAKDNNPSESGQLDSESNTCYIKLNKGDNTRSIILDPITEYSDLEENWFRCTVLGPLALRGWCLQEKLLSRRILYYGNRQIYWQCALARKAADGEDVPVSAARSQGSIGSDVSDWPDLLSLRQLHQEAVNSGSLEQLQAVETKIYKTWHNILFLYVNRRLTFESDKLPGLAGMATLIHELTNDRYVAGFWLKYLPVSLLWTGTKLVSREDAPRVIADLYELEKPEWEKTESKRTGPSWSWCLSNVNDILDFWADHNEQYRTRFWRMQDVQIKDVSVDIVGNNPFGQVSSGQLVLQGYTYQRWDVRCLDPGGWRIYGSLILGFCPHSPWNRNLGNDSGSEDRAVLWDYWPRQKLSLAFRLWKHILRWLIDIVCLLLWQGLGGFYRNRSQTDCGACNQYLCIHILSLAEKTPGKDGKHDVDLWSLILERVPGQVEKYRRIGIARKEAHVTEDEFRDELVPTTGGKSISKVFQGWKYQEVVIV